MEILSKSENDKGQTVLTFRAELSYISDEERENINGSKYHGAVIKFIDGEGNESAQGATIYSKNLEKGVLEIGKTYVCTATFLNGEDEAPFISVAPFDSTPIKKLSAKAWGLEVPAKEALQVK